MRKLVVAEIEAEEQRRTAQRLATTEATSATTPKTTAPVRDVKPKQKPAARCSPPKRKDFFGRIIDSPAPTAPLPRKGTAASKIAASAPLPAKRYRYQEGFTNAVRRKLLVKDLL